MIVLEKALEKVHEEIDMVTTPSGDAVAMVHCNNCTSDLNAWVNIFKEFAESFGVELNERTNVKTPCPNSYTTNVPKVFVAGDMHRGQSLVVWAIREGREAAMAVEELLLGYTNLQ